MSWKAVIFILGGLLIGGLLGGMILLSGNQRVAANREQQIPQKGQKFPDLVLESLDGDRIAFSSFAGKPIVINFWASWCEPCKEEMPLFEAVYRQQNADVMVLGVNYNEPANVIRRFIEERQITFPILLDMDGKVAERFQVFGFPTTYFVDGEGVLRAAHVGQLNEALLNSYLREIGAEIP